MSSPYHRLPPPPTVGPLWGPPPTATSAARLDRGPVSASQQPGMTFTHKNRPGYKNSWQQDPDARRQSIHRVPGISKTVVPPSRRYGPPPPTNHAPPPHRPLAAPPAPFLTVPSRVAHGQTSPPFSLTDPRTTSANWRQQMPVDAPDVVLRRSEDAYEPCMPSSPAGPPPPLREAYEPCMPSSPAGPPPPLREAYEPCMPSSPAGPPPPLREAYEPCMPSSPAGPPPPLREAYEPCMPSSPIEPPPLDEEGEDDPDDIVFIDMAEYVPESTYQDAAASLNETAEFTDHDDHIDDNASVPATTKTRAKRPRKSSKNPSDALDPPPKSAAKKSTKKAKVAATATPAPAAVPEDTHAATESTASSSVIDVDFPRDRTITPMGDSLFWCFMIMYRGFLECELETSHASRCPAAELRRKPELVTDIDAQRDAVHALLKAHKLGTVSQLISAIMYDARMSLRTFCTLCTVFPQRAVILCHNHTAWQSPAMTAEAPANAVVSVIREDSADAALGARRYTFSTDTMANASAMLASRLVTQDLDCPLRPVASYRVPELQEMAAQLGMPTDLDPETGKKWNKANLYHALQQKVVKC